MEVRERILEANGLRFSALEAGDGPTILCLHGFPDTRHTFRPLIHALAPMGYRVVAPQLRGYEASSLPPDGALSIRDLVEDVAGWIDALEVEKVHLVGHDWGAIIGYAAATALPHRLHTLTTISVPHLRHFRQRIWRYPGQWRRSWYLLFFQLRLLPEALIKAHDFALLRRLIATWSPGWGPPPEWFAPLRAAFSNPRVLRAALGYYRRLFDWRSEQGRASVALSTAPIEVPTLVMMGARDGCMSADLAWNMMEDADFPKGLTRETVPDAGHFLPMEAPKRVADHIHAFHHRVMSARDA